MSDDKIREAALDVLEQSIQLESEASESARRRDRLVDLISDFGDSFDCGEGKTIEYAPAWHFCITTAFRDSLDVKFTQRKVKGKTMTQWTQGSWFNFEKGCTIYDSPKAYLPWNLHNFDICLDVIESLPAKPAQRFKEETEQGTEIRHEPREPGAVWFMIYQPDSSRKELVERREMKLTQDEFIRLLISGPPKDWDRFLVDPVR